MQKLTFQQLDVLKVKREAMKRELVERLTGVLFASSTPTNSASSTSAKGDAIRIEAYERARGKLTK